MVTYPKIFIWTPWFQSAGSFSSSHNFLLCSLFSSPFKSSYTVFLFLGSLSFRFLSLKSFQISSWLLVPVYFILIYVTFFFDRCPWWSQIAVTKCRFIVDDIELYFGTKLCVFVCPFANVFILVKHVKLIPNLKSDDFQEFLLNHSIRLLLSLSLFFSKPVILLFTHF